MNTIDAMRLFCDGNTSMHDIRALMLSMGHSNEDFVAAFARLINEPDAQIRFRAAQRDELYSEFYLRV